MADRWLIQYGEEKEALRIVGKATTRAHAASVAQEHFDGQPSVAQEHFDGQPNDPPRERIVFDPENPAGEYRCRNGWYRITRLGSGQWAAIK